MEVPVMAIFFAVQTFLVSMILGVVIWEAKIGSSPFILLREALYLEPIFTTNPDFVPPDGTGLNPLLQNYWMVIHPPTLFLGFALTLNTFCLLYCRTVDWKIQRMDSASNAMEFNWRSSIRYWYFNGRLLGL